MKTLLTPGMMAAIACGTRAGAAMMEIVRFYLDFYKSVRPDIAGCPLHDPLAVAVAEDPSLVKFEPMQLDVELAGEITRGQLIADRRSGVSPNVDVAMEVDLDRFAPRFVEALRTVGLT